MNKVTRRRFSGVFRGYEIGTLAKNVLIVAKRTQRELSRNEKQYIDSTNNFLQKAILSKQKMSQVALFNYRGG